VGVSVGAEVGIDVGSALGTYVGADVGVSVGAEVEIDVGSALGTYEGAKIGVCVGIADGFFAEGLVMHLGFGFDVCFRIGRLCFVGDDVGLRKHLNGFEVGVASVGV
jgi:hypothetical protein